MDIDKVMLPGLTRLYWLDAAGLPPMMNIEAAAGIELPILTDLCPVAFCGVPTLERSSRTVNGKPVETATLKFFTRSLILELERTRNVAFVAVDANNQAWLIGSHNIPHCIVTHTLAVPAPGEPTGVSYEIRHTGLHTPVRCKIYE